jgi:putative mycofactocin binding protein MftB
MFDLERAWPLNGRVALRPEQFGALAYDFGTRRLSFLKSRKLVAVVKALAEHGSGRSACDAAGVIGAELPSYTRAVTTLADTGIIRPKAES